MNGIGNGGYSVRAFRACGVEMREHKDIVGGLWL